MANSKQAGSRMTLRDLVVGCLLLLVAGLVVDTLVWGWVGFLVTVVGGLVILPLVVYALKRASERGTGAAQLSRHGTPAMGRGPRPRLRARE